MIKKSDKKTTRYNLLLISIVLLSLIILGIFVFFALTFLIKNINLLIKPVNFEKEVKQLNIQKAKEIFGDINQSN